jgi:hypothetical protein
MKLIYKMPVMPFFSFKKKEPDKKSFTRLEKEEKMVTMGIYSLLIIITISLMLIIFNLLLID